MNNNTPRPLAESERIELKELIEKFTCNPGNDDDDRDEWYLTFREARIIKWALEAALKGGGE